MTGATKQKVRQDKDSNHSLTHETVGKHDPLVMNCNIVAPDAKKTKGATRQSFQLR